MLRKRYSPFNPFLVRFRFFEIWIYFSFFLLAVPAHTAQTHKALSICFFALLDPLVASHDIVRCRRTVFCSRPLFRLLWSRDVGCAAHWNESCRSRRRLTADNYFSSYYFIFIFILFFGLHAARVPLSLAQHKGINEIWGFFHFFFSLLLDVRRDFIIISF